MTTDNDKRLERRVIAAAEAALAARQFVTPIDVLLGLGWLAASSVQAWRKGRIPYLEAAVTANLKKISRAMRYFRRWAQRRGLKPSETAYVRRASGRPALRFSKSGKPSIERAYRTHWVSPRLSERKRERLAERQSRPPDLIVISPLDDWICSACEGTGELLIMDEPGPLRARRGGRARERRAALPGRRASPRAPARARRPATRRRGRRADEAVRDGDRPAVPRLPARARAIAGHAAARGSGRVGRSAAGRTADPAAVELAVIASVRHQDTRYDELLMAGVERAEARDRVREDVDRALERWRRG